MTKYLLITSALFANLSIASAATVEISTTVPFNCNNALSLVEEALKAQCQKLGLRLTDSSVSNCQYSHDDGGYVDYYDATVIGYCSK